ncbi:MAG: hypothetical protein LGB58_02800 [Sulfurovum sp.]|nr:hypothetical protein [Sulfurovum sp.]
MAFYTPRTDDLKKIGEGELIDDNCIVRTFPKFEDGLLGGRFCWYDQATDTIKNLPEWTNTQNPPYGTALGMVYRNVANATEDGGSYTDENVTGVDVIITGLVSMRVSGTVSEGDVIYADTSPTTRGFATAQSSHDIVDSNNAVIGTSNHPLVRGVAYKKLNDDLWIIRLN